MGAGIGDLVGEDREDLAAEDEVENGHAKEVINLAVYPVEVRLVEGNRHRRDRDSASPPGGPVPDAIACDKEVLEGGGVVRPGDRELLQLNAQEGEDMAGGRFGLARVDQGQGKGLGRVDGQVSTHGSGGIGIHDRYGYHCS
jgi:hypothetical protein